MMEGGGATDVDSSSNKLESHANSGSGSSSLSTPIAVVASPSRVDDMVTWVTTNVAALGGCSLLASPPELADRLLQTQRMALDVHMLSLRVETLTNTEKNNCAFSSSSDEESDVVLAAKVLAGEIRGVILFKDHHSTVAVPDLSLLARVCTARNIPLALNPATADLCLRGVAKTRVVYLIFNPVAGQGNSETDLKIIRSILEPTMILHVIMTEKDRDVGEQAREVVQWIQATSTSELEDADSNNTLQSILVGSGGDGTISAVAGATLNSGIPFASIPRGTANAFSVAMGIPTNVDDACRNILTGRIRTIDGVKCNDETTFINLAGVGFEAGLVSNATRELKNVFGNMAYVLGAAQQAIQQKSFQCEMQIDDQEQQTIHTKVITVANVAPPSSVFAQGFGEIIPDDGLLEVTILLTGKDDDLGELNALATLWASSLVRAPVPSENVLRIRAKKIVVNCDPPQKLLMDGEVLEMNPVTFQVVPNGLHVITPVENVPDAGKGSR